MRNLKGGELVICPLIIQTGEGQQIQNLLVSQRVSLASSSKALPERMGTP